MGVCADEIGKLYHFRFEILDLRLGMTDDYLGLLLAESCILFLNWYYNLRCTVAGHTEAGMIGKITIAS